MLESYTSQKPHHRYSYKAAVS